MLLSNWQHLWGVKSGSCMWSERKMLKVWPSLSLPTLVNCTKSSDAKFPAIAPAAKCTEDAGCKTDTRFHAWTKWRSMNWCAALQKPQCPPSQLSGPGSEAEMRPPSSWKNAEVSPDCAIDERLRSIALAVRASLGSDKRSRCWMVISYW